jgi:homocysteine S-methyltransferase
MVAVGINCTSPKWIESLLAGAVGYAQKPLLAYPNSGESWEPARRCWREEAGERIDWAGAARRWYETGARLVGGCCRTTPAVIRQIAQALAPRGQ